MDVGGNRSCGRRVEIGSIDIEGNIRCRRRRRDVIRRDISCFSTDITSGVCFLVCKGFEELVGKHKKRAVAVLFLALEVTSFLLEACGKTQKSYLLAALILSAFGCVLTIFSCLIQRSYSSTTLDAERQLGVVELSFSLVQLIATFLAVVGVKIITNYNASVLLLVFALIAVVFVFKKNENGSDMSLSSPHRLQDFGMFTTWALMHLRFLDSFGSVSLKRKSINFPNSIAFYARLTPLKFRFSEIKLGGLLFSYLDVIQRIESRLRHEKDGSSNLGYTVPILLTDLNSNSRKVPMEYLLESVKKSL